MASLYNPYGYGLYDQPAASGWTTATTITSDTITITENIDFPAPKALPRQGKHFTGDEVGRLRARVEEMRVSLT